VDRAGARAAAGLHFSFYYRHLLGAELLASARCGAYNLHGSLLPRYRGRAPANWVLVNGETETGVTLHRMVQRPDAGPILAQQRVPIADEDTAFTLHGKLREAARALLDAALPRLARGELPEVPQDERRPATLAGARPKMAASTGAARRARCTTWCAPSRSLIRAPLRRWASAS